MESKSAISLLAICVTLVTVYVVAQDIILDVDETAYLTQLKEGILPCEKQHICGLTYSISTGEVNVTCVPKDVICDNVTDCPDGSDELLCDRCKECEIICRDTYTCAKVCDGIKQCTTGEDEMQCGVKCKHGYVLCNDRETCAKTCDGIDDCINGTDEEGCPTKCPFGELLCQDLVTCAHGCNNVTECPGGEDESYCPFNCFCQPGEYACRNASICLPRNDVCEGTGDAPSTSCGVLEDDEESDLAGTVCST